MRSAFKTIYFHYSLIQYHKDIIWIIVSQNGSSDLFIIQVLTVLSKHSQRMLWLHCKSITVAFQTWKQLKCDPLQSQIPWLWSLVMLQWFAEVRLRCEQVGLTEWGFREGNRYWIYRIPWKPCHSQHILLRSWHRIIPHLRHMTQVTVQQPMQCSNSTSLANIQGVIHQQFPQEIYWGPELIHLLLSNCLYLQLLQFVNQFYLSFWPALITCQAETCRVGVHWPSCLISSWPSPPASQMPRLPAHCLHTSIKSSIFLCSTPDLAINLLLFCSPPSTISKWTSQYATVMSSLLCFIHSHWACLSPDAFWTGCLTKPRLQMTLSVRV